MTETQKQEIIELAYEYMRTHKSRDRNKESISRQRILLFMALERAEEAVSEPRRHPEEGDLTRAGGNGTSGSPHVG